MSKVAIVNPKRTAIGNFNGTLAEVRAVDLGARVMENSVGEFKELIEEVYIGQVLQAGIGQNPARQAAFNAGLSKYIPATTINTVCGSGMHSVALAYQSILTGQIQTAFAGGMESMSNAPYLLQNARNGYRMGNGQLIDTLVADGLTCPFQSYHMGITAENVAQKYEISRDMQDEYVCVSQTRASEARTKGYFTAEIVPVSIKKKREEILFAEDEFIRPDTTKEKLAQLKPAFKADGTVTAGNASGVNDGAAGMVLMSEESLRTSGATPTAYIKGYALVGLEPEYMGMGPTYSIQKLFKTTGMNIKDIDLFELNEAFASQALAVLKELGLSTDTVNISGGAIALGHPIGASGARILVTLSHALQRMGKRYGIASLCIGTGMGIAMLIENPNA